MGKAILTDEMKAILKVHKYKFGHISVCGKRIRLDMKATTKKTETTCLNCLKQIKKNEGSRDVAKTSC